MFSDAAIAMLCATALMMTIAFKGYTFEIKFRDPDEKKKGEDG